MKNEKAIIFCDGASSGNPGPGGWGAIFSDGSKVKELGGGEKNTTNNRMEISGAMHALSLLKTGQEADVFTDSQYLINGITKWIWNWVKNDWKIVKGSKETEVANRDLWENLFEICKGKKINWNYVSGHSGIPGNERCDVIATSFSLGKKIDLFDDTAKKYEIDLKNIVSTETNLKSKKKSKGGQAYSYLSLVNGKFNIDKTWAECEKRVKGIKGGVKFKKSFSADDEKLIMKDWGL